MRTETELDFYIKTLLTALKIPVELQSSRNVEIAAALQSASKNFTGRPGYPDIISVFKDFVLVMENKSDQFKLLLRDGNDISLKIGAVKDYAVNGAIFYARKIIEGSSYKKIFAFGNVGDQKRHIFKPFFIGVDTIKELPAVETFINFTAENIDDYYRRAVLGQKTRAELELKKIIDQAGALHEHLRNYGQLRETEKPLVVSAIILALAEGLDCQTLNQDEIKNDGAKILDCVNSAMKRAKVSQKKMSAVLDQFRFIQNRPLLNAVHKSLDKSPLRYFAEYIRDNIYSQVKTSSSDALGIFYREFVSYSGGDGQTLGVVLTPPHITELFCDLVDLKADDIVLDPCCGTGSFLLAALSYMLKLAKDDSQRDNIKKCQLHGVEIRDDMFSIATTSMILRGDGKSNLICDDFFTKNAGDFFYTEESDGQTIRHNVAITVGFMNPPYSQAKNTATKHLSELRFIEHLLDSVTTGGRVAAIVPVSAMIGKTKDDKVIKRSILEKHTLKGVISLSKNTFYQIGVVPCIAIFTAGIHHPKNKLVKFINFEDDGFELKKHEGYLPTARAADRRQFLLDCWNDNVLEVPSSFMVRTTVDADDEWLHSFYYYNDELPTDADFTNTIADYLTFEFNMIVHGRGYLFDGAKKNAATLTDDVPPLQNKSWREFVIEDLFEIKSGKRLTKSDMIAGNTPFIGATDSNNGITAFVGNHNISEDENVLGVNYNGSVVENFYHPYHCIFSDDVKRFKLKNFGNRFTYLFLKTAILCQKNKFTYGYKFNETRMRRQSILLPVNDAGEPDFDYMENYIRQREESLVEQYLKHIILPENSGGGIVPLSEKTWQGFRLLNYFDFVKGDQNNMTELEAGDTPLISAKNTNNGYKDFVARNDRRIFSGNCLTINNDGDGGAGISYYQPTDFLLDTHVTALIPRLGMSAEILLFIARCITIQREKFGHGYSLNNKRLNVFRVMLPVNDAGEPDFEYMEAYTRWQFAELLKKYEQYRAEEQHD